MSAIKLVRCKACKTKIMPQGNGFYHFCSNDCRVVWLSSESGKKFLASTKKKVLVESEKKERVQKKEQLESLKSLSQLLSETKRVYQLWVRLRDRELPCISCGTTSTTEWQGSHYFSADKYKGLVFDERNCHKSCEHCNKFLHGNLIEYRRGLIARYGVQYLEELESISDANRRYKYTKDQLRELKEKYNKKISELRKRN